MLGMNPKGVKLTTRDGVAGSFPHSLLRTSKLRRSARFGINDPFPIGLQYSGGLGGREHRGEGAQISPY